MTQFSFYTNGVLNAIPGQVLESDAKCITFLNPQSVPLYANTLIGLPSFPASSNTSFSYVQNTTGVTVSANIVTDTTPTGDKILAQFYAILPRQVQVSFNSISNFFIFTSTIAGVDGAFTLNIAGANITNSSPPGVASTLKVGRILVPVTDNVDLAVPNNDSTRRYRYPRISDTQAILQQAVVSVLSAATNIPLVGGRDSQGTILPGSTAPGLEKGLICVYPITALSGTSNVLLETNVSNDTVGRLTATATATTIGFSFGKVFVESGTTTAGRPAAVRL